MAGWIKMQFMQYRVKYPLSNALEKKVDFRHVRHRQHGLYNQDPEIHSAREISQRVSQGPTNSFPMHCASFRPTLATSLLRLCWIVTLIQPFHGPSYFCSLEADTQQLLAGARRSTLTFAFPTRTLGTVRIRWRKSPTHHCCRKIVLSVVGRCESCEEHGDVQGDDGTARGERVECRK